MPILSQRVVVFRFAGGLAILAGVAALALSPLVGQKVFDYLWGVEPLALIGAVIVSVGLSAVTVSYLLADLMRKKGLQADGEHEAGRGWAEITKQYFELFHHDLGRPLARIFANGRELRASLAASRQPIENGFATLLDEIDRQTPSFRLMLSNIQVLVQLAGPRQPASLDPVEPSEVVRRIVGRYARVADQVDKEVTWWAEPTEFGIIASDSAVIEHIVTNTTPYASRLSTSRSDCRGMQATFSFECGTTVPVWPLNTYPTSSTEGGPRSSQKGKRRSAQVWDCSLLGLSPTALAAT